MNTAELYKIFIKYPKISTDTREITGDCIFFALKGLNFDGNTFAAEALKKGARYAVVDNPEAIENEYYILVDNVLDTFQKLAAFHRQKLGLNILAITGSNGKTTTKELIASVLSRRYNVGFTQGNLNNHIGVPLSLLKMKEETEIGVIEMGANHPGEIKKLCEIADPDFGLITNIGKAHLEGFGSFEGVINAKAELYRYLETKNGKIFINGNNSLLSSIAGNTLSKIEYGTEPGVYLRGEVVNQTPYLNIRIWFPKGILYLNSKLVGDYNFENLMAAACVGKYFGVDALQIQKAVKKYYPGNFRSQLMKKGSNTIIMDAYNANPTSMQASINNFISFDGKRKCLILGDMLELGPDSVKEHQKITDILQPEFFDKIFLVGRNFSLTRFPDRVLAFEDTASLSRYIRQNPLSDSVILIKGSRGIKLEKILECL